MESVKYFFSYSRQNVEFVKKLATDLKEAGANVWLDQKDIAPGSRWDESIEAALQVAKGLIVVLSNASVKSQNVMDEVNYAINQGKKIVPIMFEPCPVPFRLDRFQYIDFTGDYEAALQILLRTLLVNEAPPRRANDYSDRSREQLFRREVTSSASKEKKIGLMPVVLGLSAIFIIALVIMFLILKNENSSHETASNTQLLQAPDTISVNPAIKGNTEKQSSADSTKADRKSNIEEDAPPKRKTDPSIQKTARSKRIEPTPSTSPSVIKIDGSWRDVNNAYIGSRITQDGKSYRFEGWGFIPQGIRYQSTGRGSVNGQNITNTYTATYENGWQSTGSCSGTISADGSQMTVTCTDNIMGTFVSSTVRQ